MTPVEAVLWLLLLLWAFVPCWPKNPRRAAWREQRERLRRDRVDGPRGEP